MNKVTVGDKSYIKASVIAKNLGYTTDYVGQLCRAKKVEAQLIGRSWYVDEESLKSHKSARYRSTKAASSKLIRNEVGVSAKAFQDQDDERSHFYDRANVVAQKVAISYATDEAELLPVPKKTNSSHGVKLDVGLADAKALRVSSKHEKYNFENPQKPELIFHGTLKVTNVNQEVSVSEDAEDVVPKNISITKKVSKKQHGLKQNQKIMTNHTGVIAMQRPQQQVMVQQHRIRASVSNEVDTLGLGEEMESAHTGVYLTVSTVLAVTVVIFILGLEAHVVGSSVAINVEYVFLIKNVLAQLYASL